ARHDLASHERHTDGARCRSLVSRQPCCNHDKDAPGSRQRGGRAQVSAEEGMMFEGFVPRLKIGCLMPGSVIDNHAFEFYRLAPPGVMLVMVGVGLREFSRHDVERVFAPLERYLDQLMERGIDLVIQNGVPLPILIGIEAHDRMVAHMASYTRLPATSTVLSVVQAAADLGIRKVVPVNKWTEEMNQSLAAFFARAGVSVIGTSTKP